MPFRKISLSNNLVAKIENIMKKIDRYRSIAEFISEAVRLRIEQLERESSVDYSVAPHAVTMDKEKRQQ